MNDTDNRFHPVLVGLMAFGLGICGAIVGPMVYGFLAGPKSTMGDYMMSYAIGVSIGIPSLITIRPLVPKLLGFLVPMLVGGIIIQRFVWRSQPRPPRSDEELVFAAVVMCLPALVAGFFYGSMTRTLPGRLLGALGGVLGSVAGFIVAVVFSKGSKSPGVTFVLATAMVAAGTHFGAALLTAWITPAPLPEGTVSLPSAPVPPKPAAMSPAKSNYLALRGERPRFNNPDKDGSNG